LPIKEFFSKKELTLKDALVITALRCPAKPGGGDKKINIFIEINIDKLGWFG